MKLRQRSQVSEAGVAHVKQKKKKHKKTNGLRRSERIKADEKVQSKEIKKDLQKTNKKQLKSKKGKDGEDSDSSPSEQLPEMISVTIKDILQEASSVSDDKKYLLDEATTIFECRFCKAFFREFAMFLRHKQRYCTELNQENQVVDQFNPFFNKDFIDMDFSDGSFSPFENLSDCGSNSCQDVITADH